MSLGELAQHQETARDEIRRAEPQRRSVFISFTSEDLPEVNLLRGQAKNKDIELDFIDRSLQEPFRSENAEYIKRGLRERIRQASVTLVYLSTDTHKSEWVDWEIRESRRQGKGIVAMYAGDKSPVKLPRALSELGIKPVRWSHDGLVRAIDEASKSRE